MNARRAREYNADRLMKVLLAPVVSEKSTCIADKYEQVDLSACRRTRPSRRSRRRSS